MSKSNDKQNRTDGTITSGNMKMPTPITSSNSPLGSLNNKDNKTIQKENNQNKLL